jgi:hypothetical protein
MVLVVEGLILVEQERRKKVSKNGVISVDYS